MIRRPANASTASLLRAAITTWHRACDAVGRRRSGVLEQSWRAGGASGAEIAALEAFRADPSLPSVRAITREVYGRRAGRAGGTRRSILPVSIRSPVRSSSTPRTKPMSTRDEPVYMRVEDEHILGTVISPGSLLPGALFVHGWGGDQQQYLARAHDVAALGCRVPDVRLCAAMRRPGRDTMPFSRERQHARHRRRLRFPRGPAAMWIRTRSRSWAAATAATWPHC